MNAWRLISLPNLREAGHDTRYIAEELTSATDLEIVSIAEQERRLLLTEDKDFGELVVRRAWRIPGLILLRLNTQNLALRRSRLTSAVDKLGERLFGRLTVVEDTRVRSRPLR
jgi:predicted nuclease of predicted toxin-antitoxin system